jgi:hypothetical protein
MTTRATIVFAAATLLLACTPAEPEELDPMIELRPNTFKDCTELEGFLNAQPDLPGYALGHSFIPADDLGFEDVNGFDHMSTDGDFVYVANGQRLSIFAERDQQARAVGAVVVGDERFNDRILGVHIEDRKAVVLVGMSQESAPLRDTVLPSRPVDAAILRVMVFDVTDPRSPNLERSIFIDGGLDRAWVVNGKVTVAARSGFHNPSATEGRGRNLPASFPYLYDLHVESGDAWVHQDSPEAYCTNTTTSNVARFRSAHMLVSFDLADEEPGLSSALLLDDVVLRHATRDAAVFTRANGAPSLTGRELGTYIYRYSTDGDVARVANWTQVTGKLAGIAPIDERDGELRVGMEDRFWLLSVPDGPGPLERNDVVRSLLPREFVMEWRYRGAQVYGLSYELEERGDVVNRYMVWRMNPYQKNKQSIGPDMPPEQVPDAFHLVDDDELAYVTKEIETERGPEGEEIPVREHFRGRVVDLSTIPARRVGAFQYVGNIGGGSNFGGRVMKFSNDLYGIEVPKNGQITIHQRTDNGVLIPAQSVDHVDEAGLTRSVRDTLLFGTTLWTMSEAALALIDMESVGVTHYFDL